MSNYLNRISNAWHLLASAAYTTKKTEYEIVARKMQDYILHSTEMGVTNSKYCDHDIIVSLTTYGKRIYTVALVIESLMQQTVKANKIILWLDYSFEEKRLPQSLINQQKRGLEISYCNDIRSYKKLIPTLKKYPDAAVITADDDLIYEYDMLEKLIWAYMDNPYCIYCNRMHKMVVDKKTKLLRPYKDWKLCCDDMASDILNFPTGGGGVLYPPKSLSDEVFNEKIFLETCTHADDVWFKAMSMLCDYPVNRVFTHSDRGEEYVLIDEGQDTALALMNYEQSMNDIQIKAVFEKYKLYDKIRKYVD